MARFEDPEFYGDRWADVYDERFSDFDPTPAVEFLAGLAGDARALELGIGTGRIALPLAGRGVAVEGVDASTAMVERLRAKPGGESIPVRSATWRTSR
jgi:SAM-dependent methyltransferase